MSYSMPWGSKHPGCVIFLLDRSSSMDASFVGQKIGAGRKLKDAVPTVLNRSLDEMGRRCVKGEIVAPRVDVAVVGYGSTVHSALGGELSRSEIVSIVDIMEKPLRMDERVQKEMDDTGQILELKVQFPIWVDAEANGGTPMCAALAKAREIAERWIRNHPNSFPPLVVNITDGASTDGDPRPAALQLRSLRTSDGELLLFNCHLSATSQDECLYPGPSDRLPSDNYAPVLFEMSSEIPDGMRNMAKELGVKADMKPGDRGFAYNTDVSGVVKMIQFATVQAARAEADADQPAPDR